MFFPWEVQLIELLQSFSNPLFDSLFIGITMLGSEFVLVGIVVVLYLCSNKEWAKRLGVVSCVVLTVSPLIKNLVMRRRPYFDHESIRCLFAPHPDASPFDLVSQGFSFPSMHSANSMAFFGTLALCIKKHWAWCAAITAALLIGISRMVLGVHYPTDVLFGWMIGAAAIVLASLMQQKVKSYLAMLLLVGTITFPGWFLANSNDFFTSYGIMLGTFLAFHFEEKFVRFEMPSGFLQGFLRIVGALVLFLTLSLLLQAPFPIDLLESNGFLAHLLRCARYAIGVFVVVGVYPLCFKLKFLS